VEISHLAQAPPSHIILTIRCGMLVRSCLARAILIATGRFVRQSEPVAETKASRQVPFGSCDSIM
jgi:hypothetical protein